MNNKLTLLDIADFVSNKSGLTKKESEQFVKDFFALASEVISKGETLNIKGVGVFSPVWVDARVSVDVNTKEPIEIPGHYKVSFTPDASMRDAVNAPFAAFTTEVIPINDKIDNSEEDVKLIEDKTIDVQEEEESVVIEHSQLEAIQEDAEVAEKDDAIEETEIGVDENPEVEDREEEPVEVVVNTNLPDDKKEEDIDNSPKSDDEAEEVLLLNNDDVKREIQRRTRNGYIAGFLTAIVIVLLLLFGWWLFNKGGNCFTLSFSSFKLTAGDKEIVSIQAEETQVIQKVDSSLENNVDSLAVLEGDSISLKSDIKKDIEEPVIETIERGKFLTTIANKYYGSKIFWVYIYYENREKIWNPRDLQAGFKVVVPPASKYNIDATNPKSIEAAKELEKQILYEIE